MTSSSKRMELAVAKMKEAGWRITEQRKNLYTLLLDSKEAMSAKDIMEVYKHRFPVKNIDLVTIYRIMDKFQDLELIHKVSKTGHYVVCEHLDCSSSYHIIEVCKSCDAILEKHIPAEIVEKLFEYVREKHEFLPSTHSFSLHGYCKKCG